MNRIKRIKVAQDTLKILTKGYYRHASGETVDISRSQKLAEESSVLYTPNQLETVINTLEIIPTAAPTAFEVNGLTTLDSVRKEAPSSNNIVCLNFASARKPGGGFRNGSQAQEESIARASGLYPCLMNCGLYYTANKTSRPGFYTHHMIYSPAVPIFKYETGELMEQPILVSVITAPAVNMGVIKRRAPDSISLVAPEMRKRIDMVLAICYQKGYDTLILGAWGCGVFQNDPRVIAELFHHMLTGKYKNAFRKVVFSVYAKDKRFISPFLNLFEKS
ncbi:MAG: TIGR02452 family protein [Bacteroidota bacterium]